VLFHLRQPVEIFILYSIPLPFDSIPAILGEILDPEENIRAGVSAMGFGGINCHVTLESGDAAISKLRPSIPEKNLLVSNQDTEVFLITADSAKI
jgi:enediyne polyketide synthase